MDKLCCPECGSTNIEEVDRDPPYVLYECQECKLNFEAAAEEDEL
jgi:ribosomal protein L37AE/L43A